VNNKTVLTLLGFVIIGAGGMGFLALNSFLNRQKQEQLQTRIVIPRAANNGGDSGGAEQMAYEDSITTRTAMNEGELVVAVLNQDFDGDPAEEQIVAFRDLREIESPVSIAFIDFDEERKEYRRLWTASTAAARPGTISLFTQDLIGDRGICVILTGMNNRDEHTMTVFRRNPQPASGEAFPRIAEISINGSITIQETERSQAYQQGIAGDKSFVIAAYSHDANAANILDQLEITYAFNPGKGLYEQSKVTHIPGSQIERRRLRELLSGERGVFENFINDLWYYVSPQGTLDNRQYIYFDPSGREIIFFGDETQQVFVWQNSNPTRYGLYISSQNISVTTLRRFLDIELESLDSIRIKVFEDVRLKIAVSASWDGSYRRAGTGARTGGEPENAIRPAIDALYDSSLGRLRFHASGEYDLSSGGMVSRGRYVFFRVNGQELLELRPQGEGRNKTENGAARMIYRLEPVQKNENGGTGSPSSLNLFRVRLGASGIQDLHEGAITLTAAQ
jgi:hypothetical protein